MPGTHLLPPNLLKLFAPRPPLPYSRPVDRDIDRIFNKNVVGVAHILVQLKEANTDSLITAGTSDAMEEGEELVFTHAEETKRQIRREERKAKKTEEFKIAKETCQLTYIADLLHWRCNCIHTDKPADDPEAVGDPYKTLFISRLVLVLILTPLLLLNRHHSINQQQKQI
jgi:U1 small nuclear ribonucleoprotein